VIYLDTSVALAQVLAEDRPPPDDFWRETLASSRLLEYGFWNRVNALRLATSHGDLVHALLGRIAFLELIPEVPARARDSSKPTAWSAWRAPPPQGRLWASS